MAAGQQVWVTDGTTAGTHQVADPYTGQDTESPTLLGLIGTDLVFAEATSDNTLQLFRTDGTAAGTRTLSSFAPNQYGLVSDSIAINGKVYVALESDLSCCEPDLWATDGTNSGTVRIDSNEGYPAFHLQPSSLRAFGDSVALLTDTENQGVELSLVNTTTNALTILETANGPASGASYGSTIASMDGLILYLSGDPNDGQQLWRSDGTLPGTVMVMNMGPGVQFSQLGQDIVMTRVGDRAIFQSENAQNGPQLWSSDGTAAGTHVLTDAGPVDANGITDTQVAGDDNLTFLYTYHVDASGNTKHLYAYLPPSDALTHLQDGAIPDAGEPMLAKRPGCGVKCCDRHRKRDCGCLFIWRRQRRRRW